jgi:hypothetical protein
MSEDRKRILDMLAAGKINVSEADALLQAMSKDQGGAKVGNGTALTKPKYLLVTVQPLSPGGSKVNVKIPLQILRAGVKLASVMPLVAKEKMNQALHNKGIQLDLDKIRPEDIEELIDALGEMTVDVVEDNQKVRVFCE